MFRRKNRRVRFPAANVPRQTGRHIFVKTGQLGSGSAVNTAMTRRTPAATSAQNNRENEVLARTRTVRRFRNRQAVGVIRTSHFAPERAAQILVERFPVQPCGVGVLHQAGLRGNSSWDSHSHAAAPAEFLLDSLRSVLHRSHVTFVIKALRRDAVTLHLTAIS